MTPEFATSARLNVEAGAGDVPREPPPVFGYVRTAVGEDARERLAKEESFYRDLHDGYRNHFDRLGEPEGTVGVAAADRDEAQLLLAAYTALDVTVVRGLASATVEAMTRRRRGRRATVRSSLPRSPGSLRSPGWRSPRRRRAAPKAAARPTRAAGSPTPSGRVVILHGVNMVYKVGSYRPADAGFGADDARFLRRHGFNTVRLGIIYKGLEPKPPAAGEPSTGAATCAASRAPSRCSPSSGIFSLLDFHQDLYNERFQGEGWPDWQVIDDGVPAEPAAGFPGQLHRQRRAATAPSTTSGRTGQVEGAASRTPTPTPGAGRGARSATARTSLGYDLLNEPWPGSAFSADNCFNTAGCATFDAHDPGAASTSG